MKILINGGRHKSGLTNTLVRAFEKLNCKTAIFGEEDLYNKYSQFLKNRYTNRTLWKLFSWPLQKKFLEAVRKEKPDLILILKGWFFCPRTLSKIKKENPQIKIFCFNPDNPFNTWHFGNSNNWIRRSIPLYDAYFIWGKFLIERIKEAGAKRAEYLPFAYDPELHYPVEVSEKEKKIYGSDIAFIGSWDEERERWLNKLIDSITDNSITIKIWGNHWQKANKKLQEKWQRKEMIGEKFSKVCNASKMILNFIRKQNSSAHNMRTFEVPACRGFMLSTRTPEQQDFFEEGKEADYFSTPEELKQKIDFYLKNEELRKKIVKAEYEKLINSDYAYTDRAKKILDIYNELNTFPKFK